MDLETGNRTYHEAQDRMRHLPNYYKWIYGIFRPYLGGEVIELGCGAGHGISVYLSETDHLTAVDYNPELLRALADRHSDAKLTPLALDLLEDWHALPQGKADAVLMMDVLEHFRRDRDFIQKAAKLLKPGGHLLMKVPAQAELYGEIDQASGHYRRYDRQDLEALALAEGLELVSLRSINRLGALAYRFKRQKPSNFSKTFSVGQLRVINWAIPLIRLGDAIPVSGGLSFACVMRKPLVA